MRHIYLDLLAISLFKNGNWLTDIVLTCWHHFNETTSDFGGDHDSMFIEQVVLVAASKHVTANNKLTFS